MNTGARLTVGLATFALVCWVLYRQPSASSPSASPASPSPVASAPYTTEPAGPSQLTLDTAWLRDIQQRFEQNARTIGPGKYFATMEQVRHASEDITRVGE